MLLLLFAQSPDILAGTAGWAGAGLLGLVLSWLLLVHLPGKDKQIKELIADHLAVEKEQRKDYRDALIQQRSEFKATLDEMLKHNERIIGGLADALTDDLKMIREALVKIK